MADLRTLVREEMERAGSPSYSFDDLGRRRDRKRRNQRIAAGVVGIAVFVAAVWIVTTVGSFDRSETSVVPGGGVTGPAETAPPPLVEPVPIGTVTRSGAGCELEIAAEPIPSGAGTLSVVNETNLRVAFEVYLLSSRSSFAQFEAVVAKAEVMFPYDLEHPNPPGAYLVLVQQEVRPSASGTITVNFTTGDAFAVVCLDYHPRPGLAPDYSPFAVVGPIVVS